MELPLKLARVAFESQAEAIYAKLENKEFEEPQKKDVDPRI